MARSWRAPAPGGPHPERETAPALARGWRRRVEGGAVEARAQRSVVVPRAVYGAGPKGS